MSIEGTFLCLKVRRALYNNIKKSYKLGPRRIKYFLKSIEQWLLVLKVLILFENSNQKPVNHQGKLISHQIEQSVFQQLLYSQYKGRRLVRTTTGWVEKNLWRNDMEEVQVEARFY